VRCCAAALLRCCATISDARPVLKQIIEGGVEIELDLAECPLTRSAHQGISATERAQGEVAVHVPRGVYGNAGPARVCRARSPNGPSRRLFARPQSRKPPSEDNTRKGLCAASCPHPLGPQRGGGPSVRRHGIQPAIGCSRIPRNPHRGTPGKKLTEVNPGRSPTISTQNQRAVSHGAE
jgi:hypothetical protein